MNYFYTIDGMDVIGPSTLTDLKILVIKGAIPKTTQVCLEGQQTWRPLSELLPSNVGAPGVRRIVSRSGLDLAQQLSTPVASKKNKRIFIVLSTVILAITALVIWQPHTESVASPNKIEDVNRLLVGTWTYTEIGHTWEKYIFNSDGTVDTFLAQPSDDDWRKVTAWKSVWKPATGKFSDTGTRWYGANISILPDKVVTFSCIFQPNGTLRLSPQNTTFTKGDKFPFSK